MFDLDGTITRQDTLLPYLRYALARHPQRRRRLWQVPRIVGDFLLDRDRGRLKGRLVHALLGGLKYEEVALLTRQFLDDKLMGLLRPAAVRAIEAHRNAGDWLVLLSASTDFYVRELGSRLGFDQVICTEVRWDGELLDGRLKGENCRGEEKTRRLLELRQDHPGLRIAAYGNAASDLHHLQQADSPLLVNASAAARRQAAALGIRVGRWH